MGIDAFIDIPNWWQPDRLVTLADFVSYIKALFKFADLSSSPYLEGNNIPKDLIRERLNPIKQRLRAEGYNNDAANSD